MKNERSYSFRFNNTKALWYLLLCFAGIPFIFLLSDNASSVIFMIILLLPMAGAFIFTFKKIKVHDEIIVGNSYLDSAYYGKINFDEIKKVYSSDMLAKPNLIIKLQNGRKLKWVPVSTLKTNKDVQALQDFIDGFSDAVAIDNAPVSPAQALVTDTVKKNNNLKEELQSVKKNNSKVGKFVIPASLGIALISFARTCIFPKIEQHKNDEVAEMFQESRQENTDLKQQAATLVKGYQHKYGPFYLYTNDSAAVIEYIPRIEPPDDYDGPLSYVFESDSLKKLLAHPDSMRWNMVVSSAPDKIYILQKGLMNMDDSTDTYVYLTEVIPEVKVADNDSTSDKPDPVPEQLTFAVPLYQHNSIVEDLKNGIPGSYIMYLSVASHRQADIKLYVAARDKEGRMNDTLFKKVVAEIKRILSRQGADTTAFFTREFH